MNNKPTRPNMNLVNRMCNMLRYGLNLAEIREEIKSDWSEEAIFLAFIAARVMYTLKG